MANLTKNLIFRPFRLDQVVREGEVDKIGELGFCFLFQFLCMLTSEKSLFFSSESGATKSGLGFCAEGLNAIMAKTSIFGQNGRPRSLICISNDFDPLYWSIRYPLLLSY